MKLFDWFRSAARSADGEADVSGVVFSGGESAEIAGLDFVDVMVAHQKWKGRLQRCVDGTSEEKLDHAVVCRDDQCVLGKWINGPGSQKFGYSPNFSTLRTEHTRFHFIAGEVVWAAQSGRHEEAREKLRTVFSKSSARVQQLLATLFLETKNA